MNNSAQELVRLIRIIDLNYFDLSALANFIGYMVGPNRNYEDLLQGFIDRVIREKKIEVVAKIIIEEYFNEGNKHLIPACFSNFSKTGLHSFSSINFFLLVQSKGLVRIMSRTDPCTSYPLDQAF
eukprot:TRINITY_DN1649_c0_g1_i3.p1 TRINITY_DN1649_c0_g1~~TRINITY_DN1649_c0_g1_i3.p1  ORF type:complete len:125 (-),score=1.95 TRINITY_DN1649_c0_g1_i3:437-811(-)